MDYKQEVQNIKNKILEYKNKTLKLTTERDTTEQELLEWTQLSKDIDKYIKNYQNISFPSEEEKRELESWLQQKADSLELINTYANRFEEINQELELISSEQLDNQAQLIKLTDQLKDISDKIKEMEATSEKIKNKETDPKKMVEVKDFKGTSKLVHVDLVEDYLKLNQMKLELSNKNEEVYTKALSQDEEDTHDNKKIAFEKVMFEKKFIDKKLEDMTDEEKVIELEKRINYIIDDKNHENTGKKVRLKFNGQTIQIPQVWRGKLFLYNVLLDKSKRRIEEKTEIASQIKKELNSEGFKVDPSLISNSNNIIGGFKIKVEEDVENKKQDAIEFINSITPDFSQNNIGSNITNPQAINLINQYNENANYLNYINELENKQKVVEYEDIYSNSSNQSNDEPIIDPSLREPVNSIRKLKKRNKIKDFIKRTTATVIASLVMITTGNALVSYIGKKATEKVKNTKPYEQVIEANHVEEPYVIEENKKTSIQIGGSIKISKGASIYKSATDSIIDNNKYKPYFGYDSERLVLATVVEFEGKQYNINAKQSSANENLNKMLNQGGKIISVLTTNKNNKNVTWDGQRILSDSEYSKLAEGWFNPDNLNTIERRIVR